MGGRGWRPGDGHVFSSLIDLQLRSVERLIPALGNLYMQRESPFQVHVDDQEFIEGM